MRGDHRSEAGKGANDCDIYGDGTITIENGREHGDALLGKGEWWIFRYSGLEFIYRKFNPSKNPQPLPIDCHINNFIFCGTFINFYAIYSQIAILTL